MASRRPAAVVSSICFSARPSGKPRLAFLVPWGETTRYLPWSRRTCGLSMALPKRKTRKLSAMPRKVPRGPCRPPVSSQDRAVPLEPARPGISLSCTFMDQNTPPEAWDPTPDRTHSSPIRVGAITPSLLSSASRTRRPRRRSAGSRAAGGVAQPDGDHRL